MVMDNIIIRKIWQEDNLIELYVIAKSKYAMINQRCYISLEDVIKNTELIKKYVENCENEVYIEFGNKQGNYTPAFSLKLLPIDSHGHLIIEADLEIDDNSIRCHRCIFYIKTELGPIEHFANKLAKIEHLSKNDSICIYDE